LGLRVRVWVNW